MRSRITALLAALLLAATLGAVAASPASAHDGTATTTRSICGWADGVTVHHQTWTHFEWRIISRPSGSQDQYCSVLFSAGSYHGVSHYMAVTARQGSGAPDTRTDAGYFMHYAGSVKIISCFAQFSADTEDFPTQWVTIGCS